jgi:hypothetical protein
MNNKNTALNIEKTLSQVENKPVSREIYDHKVQENAMLKQELIITINLLNETINNRN